MKWFKSFKFSETMYSIISTLPEKLQLKYYDAVCRYGLYGASPNFEGLEECVWIPIRDFLDYSANRRKINSDNGKKGGAPEGNTNAKKQSEIVSDEAAKQPTLFISNYLEIVTDIEKLGMYIDENTVKGFLASGIDPLWLSTPNSYFEFINECVIERYGDKTKNEKTRLFIDAVKTWGEKRREYPGWKAKKEKVKKEAEVISNAPTNCKCGTKLIKTYGINDELFCKECRTGYKLNKETDEWYEEVV